MKTLYLLRHAKAEPGGKDISDLDRTLAPRGHIACAAVGAYMKAMAYMPDCALCSPSARTKETLERVTQSMGVAPPCRFDNTLYLAAMEEIAQAVQEAEDRFSSVLVVGHNPGMHHAALHLAEPKPARLRTQLELKFPTCALAVLRFNIGRWSAVAPGQGALTDFVTPDEL